MRSSLQRTLDAIRQDPFISQQELANQLGVTRSTVASQIAELTKSGQLLGRAYVLADSGRVICIGGANQDRKLMLEDQFIPGSSLPVDSSFVSAGGVARNVAENLARLGINASLASVVGDDSAGRWLIDHCRHVGIDTSLCQTLTDQASGQYTAVLDRQHELAIALAEMKILDRMDMAWLEGIWPKLRTARLLFVDCNLSQPVLAQLLFRCEQQGIPVAVDPVSSSKAIRLDGCLEQISLITPNREEAISLTGLPESSTNEQLAERLHQLGAKKVALTLGNEGLMLASADGIKHLPSNPVTVADVTGAGDALVSGLIAGLLDGLDLEQAGHWGQAAAAITLADDLSVSPNLSKTALIEAVK